MESNEFRVTEAFISVQGEGRFVGVPSVFLRLFGCNFKCRGFGMPKGQLADDYLKVDANDPKYKTLKDLPLVHRGCDSYASWDARFRKFTKDYNVEQLVEKLLSLTPEGKWTCKNGQDIHLVITGGEPLLGWQRLYVDLFEHPRMKDLKNVTYETNTTQPIRENLLEWTKTQDRIHITFSCSPKLTVSGERWEDAIKPSVAKNYYDTPNSHLYFKFVVCDNGDIEEVSKAVELYSKAGISCPVYCMAVGGCYEEYQENAKNVTELAMQKGWRYSPRLHVDIFGNEWGT